MVTAAIWATASSTAAAVSGDDVVTPLTLRTYWRAAASISTGVATGSSPRRVVMFRHMGPNLAALRSVGWRRNLTRFSIMLSPLDDFPIHQAPKPVAVPATTDHNAYDRYWFGGFHRRGEFIVEAAFGRYPNLGVVDGSLVLAVGGVEHAFHASSPAPADPADTAAGPLRVTITEPMRSLRIDLADNETGMSAELHWKSRIGSLLEDHTVMYSGIQTIVDMSRFLQFGTWSGWVKVDGVVTELFDGDVVGVRDRSWGVRPVGTQSPKPPQANPPSAWLWAPIHFDQECRSLGYFQRPGGEIWRGDGFRLPVVDPIATITDPAAVERYHPVGQRLTFTPGTRRIERAEFDVTDAAGVVHTLELRSLGFMMMKGLGYTNPAWGHGTWTGAARVGREDWVLAEADPADFTAQHLHHIVTATVDGIEGVGLLEQIIFGPHTQFGFHDLLDGAS